MEERYLGGKERSLEEQIPVGDFNVWNLGRSSRKQLWTRRNAVSSEVERKNADSVGRGTTKWRYLT